MTWEILWKLDESQIESLRKLLSSTQNTSLDLFNTLKWDENLSELVFAKVIDAFESMTPQQIIDSFKSSNASDKFVMEILSIIEKDSSFQDEIEKRIKSRWERYSNLMWWSKSFLLLWLILAVIWISKSIFSTDSVDNDLNNLSAYIALSGSWLMVLWHFLMKFHRYLDTTKFIYELRNKHLKPVSSN